jgi:hypothetical protein
LQICLIESGGLDPKLATQHLYRGSKIGRRTAASTRVATVSWGEKQSLGRVVPSPRR